MSLASVVGVWTKVKEKTGFFFLADGLNLFRRLKKNNLLVLLPLVLIFIILILGKSIYTNKRMVGLMSSPFRYRVYIIWRENKAFYYHNLTRWVKKLFPWYISCKEFNNCLNISIICVCAPLLMDRQIKTTYNCAFYVTGNDG